MYSDSCGSSISRWGRRPIVGTPTSDEGAFREKRVKTKESGPVGVGGGKYQQHMSNFKNRLIACFTLYHAWH